MPVEECGSVTVREEVTVIELQLRSMVVSLTWTEATEAVWPATGGADTVPGGKILY